MFLYYFLDFQLKDNFEEMSLHACPFLPISLGICSPSLTKTGYWSKIYHWPCSSYHKSFHVTLMSRDRVIVRTYIKLKPSLGWKLPGKSKPLSLPKFQYLKIHVPRHMAKSSSTVRGSPTCYIEDVSGHASCGAPVEPTKEGHHFTGISVKTY